LLGSWGFEGAAELSGICFLAGLYLYIRSRRAARVPDAAAQLEKALGLASSGQREEAIALLTKTIHLNPGFWQARQHRGTLYCRGDSWDRAIEDFSAAIRLAPEEPHLYRLRAEVRRLAGDEQAAQKDFDIAVSLGGENLRAHP